MWVQEIYDILFDPNTTCVACISHGKDSNAMLRAIKLLGLPLHRIVTTDVWATQDIPAELPEMHAWKAEADARIKELYGIEVEHICAMQKEGCLRLGYQDLFYSGYESGQFVGNIHGFPNTKGAWCQKLKYEKVDIPRYILQTVQAQTDRQTDRRAKRVRICDSAQPVLQTAEDGEYYGFPIGVKQGQWCQQLKLADFSDSPTDEGRKYNIVQYLGIAADEPIRIARHIGRKNIVLPLVEIGWDEDLCGLISGYQGLLSPTYTTSTRDGCWFCHNQGVEQLRNLRKKHPDLWALLLKWDKDSPVSFKPDGHTVHDFDARFALEDQGLITPSDPWKWAYLTDMPIQLKMNF